MKLVLYPDEILSKVCEEVTEFNEELHKTLDAMRDIMTKNNGIGLAANQVGIQKRFFIMQDKKGKIWDFINPRILEQDGLIQINEGCLSAPGAIVQPVRAQNVTVEAQDRDGNKFTIVAEDIEAVCIQHETDHLNGIFFLSKVNRQQRRAALKKLGL
jgi:peptide deformylase